jgi:hypothetical protein
MAAKHRVFLTGNDRNEAQHVLGFELPVDNSDPRFVLLTDEQEKAIREFPAGAPANRGDDWAKAKVVLEAQRGEGALHAAFEGQGGNSGVNVSGTAVPAVGEKAKSDVKKKDEAKLDAEAAEDKKEADEAPSARKASGSAKS